MRALLVAALILFGNNLAFGQAVELNRSIFIGAPSSQTLADDQELYRVKWKCTPVTPRPTRRTSAASFLASISGIGDTWQASGFLLTKGAAVAPFSNQNFGTNTTTDNVLSAQVIYIVDKTLTAKSLYNTECAGEAVVSGLDSPHLAIFQGNSVTTINDQVAKFGAIIKDLLPPLFSLVNGKDLPSVDKERLEDTNTVLKNYADLIKLFTREGAVTEVKPLTLGTRRFSTPFASVEITVTTYKSLLASPVKFKAAVEDLMLKDVSVTAESLKDPVRLQFKCAAAVAQWDRLGVSDPRDRAYISYRYIFPFGPNKEELLTCMGLENATAALDYQGSSYLALSDAWRYDEEDLRDYLWPVGVINNDVGIQPQGWKLLNATMVTFDTFAGRSLLGSQRDDFAALFASGFIIEDQTDGYRFMHAMTPKGTDPEVVGHPVDLLAKLREMGYQRWGCHAQTDSKEASPFKSLENEAILVVAMKGAKGTAIDPKDAIVARVLFRDRSIAKLILTDTVSAGRYMETICPKYVD